MLYTYRHLTANNFQFIETEMQDPASTFTAQQPMKLDLNAFPFRVSHSSPVLNLGAARIPSTYKKISNTSSSVTLSSQTSFFLVGIGASGANVIFWAVTVIASFVFPLLMVPPFHIYWFLYITAASVSLVQLLSL